MIRTLLWIVAGIVLGLMTHIVVILVLPELATRDLWSRLAPLEADNRIVLLDPVVPGEPNPLRLDPELAYAVCRLDLEEGPGLVSGTLPNAFWSVAIFDRSGRVVYSTTNRAGIGNALQLGIFNPAQTRLLAAQELDIAEGVLIVEVPDDEVIVAVRLAPPHPAMFARYREALSAIACDSDSG